MDFNTWRLEQNNDYRIQWELDRTQHQQEKKTYTSFMERNSSPMQSDKSSSGVSNAS